MDVARVRTESKINRTGFIQIEILRDNNLCLVMDKVLCKLVMARRLNCKYYLPG